MRKSTLLPLIFLVVATTGCGKATDATSATVATLEGTWILNESQDNYSYIIRLDGQTLYEEICRATCEGNRYSYRVEGSELVFYTQEPQTRVPFTVTATTLTMDSQTYSRQ